MESNEKLSKHLLHFYGKLDSEDKIPLPMFHNCTKEELFDYLNNNKIVAKRKCNVFKEKLIYFFYGASKFKKGGDRQYPNESEMFSTLVLKSEAVGTVHRIFPFDTGVIKKISSNKNSNLIKWPSVVKRLGLRAQVHSINALIKHFYDSIEHYYTYNINLNKIYFTPKHLVSNDLFGVNDHLADIAKFYNTTHNGDSRLYLSEIQIKDEISISAYNVLAVITLDNMEDTLESAQFIENFGVFDTKYTKFYPSSTVIVSDAERLIEECSISITREYIAEYIANHNAKQAS